MRKWSFRQSNVGLCSKIIRVVVEQYIKAAGGIGWSDRRLAGIEPSIECVFCVGTSLRLIPNGCVCGLIRSPCFFISRVLILGPQEIVPPCLIDYPLLARVSAILIRWAIRATRRLVAWVRHDKIIGWVISRILRWLVLCKPNRVNSLL